MKPSRRKFLAGAAAIALSLGLPEISLAASTAYVPGGFTNFVQFPGDKIIYVDSSRPNDLGNGLTPATAVQKIATGIALLTNNSSDWLLHRQGQNWLNEVIASSFSLNGRSMANPMVIGSYNTSKPTVVNDGSAGLARPLLQTPAASTVVGQNTGFGNNVVFVGLEFYCYDRDPNNGAFNATARDAVATCFSWGGGSTFAMWEDCKWSFYALPINTITSSVAVKHTLLLLNRNIIVDSYGGVTIQCGGFDQIWFWENAWDKNGYNNQIGGNYLQGFGPANFSHGLYGADNQGYENPGWYIDGPISLYGNIYARDVTGWHLRCGGHVDSNLIVGNCSVGDFGRPLLGTNNYIINNVIAENIDQPYQPLAITGITQASPAVFTYTPSAAAPTDPNPSAPGSQWWIFRLTGSLPAPLTALGLYDIQNINTTNKTFTAKDHNTGVVINTTQVGGACTMYDVGTSTVGQCIGLYRVNANLLNIPSSTGPVLVANNIYVNYAGTAAYNAYTIAIEANQLSNNFTIQNNIFYKWAAKAPGQPVNLIKNDDGRGSISGNIQDTNGDGTDDNTVLPITQYTTASANTATMANYAASIGLTASLDAFMVACRARLPGTWNLQLAGITVVAWYMGKFNQPKFVVRSGSLSGSF